GIDPGRFRQPGPRIGFAPAPGGAQAVDAQPGGGGHQPGLRVGDGGPVRPVPAQPGVLDHVLGVGAAAQQPVGQGQQARLVSMEMINRFHGFQDGTALAGVTGAPAAPPLWPKMGGFSACHEPAVTASASSSPSNIPVSIRQEDLIQSVADALQYISYYHPVDYIRNLAAAWEREESPAAKDAMAQILINSRMCAEGHRPICQDTGIVTVFLESGMDVRCPDAIMVVEDMVNEVVSRACNQPENKLRASVLAYPAGRLRNTGDNTPAVVNVKVVPGGKVDVIVAAKGGGSEAKSKFAMLNPSDSIVDWVLRTVPTMGAGWCPPGMLGIGIGGTAEKAMLLAKEALMEPIDIVDLKARGPSSRLEELRLEIFEKVNALGIGAQGLGGLTTVLDIKIRDYPTHAANLPVAMIPNCAATRHAHFTLDGSGPVMLDPPSLEDWPQITYDASKGRRVDLDTVTREEV